MGYGYIDDDIWMESFIASHVGKFKFKMSVTWFPLDMNLHNLAIFF